MVGAMRFMWKANSCFALTRSSETREALTAAGAGVKGVIGASEDGESVYVVASGVLGCGCEW